MDNEGSPQGAVEQKVEREPDYFDLWVHKTEENRNLVESVQVLLDENTELKNKLYELKHGPGARKRLRRTAKEIERLFSCDICHRSYGSEGSLKYHLYLKHREAYLARKRQKQA